MAFTKVLDIDALAVGHATQVTVEGEPICVVRVADDAVAAVHDTCTHQEWSLAEGWVDLDGDRSTIECGLHGSAFELSSGRPRSLPALDPVPTYAARITEDGAIEVDAAEPTNDARPPRH